MPRPRSRPRLPSVTPSLRLPSFLLRSLACGPLLRTLALTLFLPARRPFLHKALFPRPLTATSLNSATLSSPVSLARDRFHRLLTSRMSGAGASTKQVSHVMAPRLSRCPRGTLSSCLSSTASALLIMRSSNISPSTTFSTPSTARGSSSSRLPSPQPLLSTGRTRQRSAGFRHADVLGTTFGTSSATELPDSAPCALNSPGTPWCSSLWRPLHRPHKIQSGQGRSGPLRAILL